MRPRCAEIRAGDASPLGEIRTVEASLRREIQAGDEETRRLHARAHEDVIARIAAIGESRLQLCRSFREAYFATVPLAMKLVEEVQEKHNGCAQVAQGFSPARTALASSGVGAVARRPIRRQATKQGDFSGAVSRARSAASSAYGPPCSSRRT
mgnify:CR=1 FL=1